MMHAAVNVLCTLLMLLKLALRLSDPNVHREYRLTQPQRSAVILYEQRVLVALC